MPPLMVPVLHLCAVAAETLERFHQNPHGIPETVPSGH